MRSGRPAYHIKAHFVSFFDVHNRAVVYFELDSKGNLKKNENGQFSSHMENSYIQNNALIKPNEVPIAVNPSVAKTDIKSPSKEIEKVVEEPPPIDASDKGFDEDSFGTFEDDFDIFNSYAINDTDIFFQDDNIFNFSENQPLNII